MSKKYFAILGPGVLVPRSINIESKILSVRCLSILVLMMLFTVPALAFKRQIVVAQDGSGAFRTITEAISSVPENNSIALVIYIKNGVYKEKLDIEKSKTNITLRGQDVNKTIITYDDYASKKDARGKDIGTFGSSSVYVRCDHFTAENITFENSSGPVGQAVAISVGGDKVFFRNCRFLGFQDTIYTFGDTARQYYYQCYIEGTVDFIFGAAVAVFSECEIFCKRGGYITAASTPEGQKYGYVFRDCRVRGSAPDKSFYLGRPWRPYAHVAFINCELPAMIKAEGWHDWGKESNTQTATYVEYNNRGDGFQPERRVKWSKQLTKEQAAAYTNKKIFAGWDPGK